MNPEPTPSLLSLVLTLRPAAHAESPEPLPTWFGRAAHSLLLRSVASIDPSLAESLHAESELRPFTASTLMGRFPEHRLDPSGTYMLRLTALNQTLAGALIACSQTGLLSPGQVVDLDGIPFQVEKVSWGEGEENAAWACWNTYEGLSASLLLAREPVPKRITFQLTSPAAFKKDGRTLPFPSPELVFGSLLSKWNSFAPIAFPPEARRYAEECLAISRYRLSTRAVPTKGPGLSIGAVGQITFTSLNYDRYWMTVMAVLAEYAIYAGVGAGVSHGMGQARRMAEGKEQAN